MQIQLKTPIAGAANYKSCAICNRPLFDPISVQLGIGPVCRVNQKNLEMQERTLHIFGSRASYRWEEDNGIISIIDLDQGYGPSVTNDIQNILRDIAQELGHGLEQYRIIYRDSRGIWDGVHLMPNGVRFYSINETDINKAKAKVS